MLCTNSFIFYIEIIIIIIRIVHLTQNNRKITAINFFWKKYIFIDKFINLEIKDLLYECRPVALGDIMILQIHSANVEF